MRTPKLIQLDMSLIDECKHPEISTSKTYLCLIGGRFYAGQFSKQWYGLNFQGVYDAGLQLDAPGTNASRWQQIWEIKR